MLKFFFVRNAKDFIFHFSGRAIEEVHAVLSEIAVAAELDMKMFRKNILFTESFRMSVKAIFIYLNKFIAKYIFMQIYYNTF